MHLDEADIQDLHTGALFLACAADQAWCSEQQTRTINHMHAYNATSYIKEVDELDPDDLILSVGFVNNGFQLSEIRPCGDEFILSVRRVEQALGVNVSGIIPLAAANINGLASILTAMQLGVPVIDADPMGRVFPLLYQSVFTLAGLPAGPLGATGPTGESALIDVSAPRRAERLVRVLAGEFGGWAATASYPMTASQLKDHAIHGTVSRMLRIGRILNSDHPVSRKHASLRASEGVTRIIRARVSNVEGLSRPSPPGQPDNPSTAVLIEEAHGRIIQLEIQNELLMVMVDGSVEAVIPDIITLMRPEDGSVAGLDDLWVGNTLDIVVLPAHSIWYSPEGIELVGPDSAHLWLRGRERG
jgi:DUF917 family protein